MEPPRRDKLLFFLCIGAVYLIYFCLLIWLAATVDRLITG